MSMRCLAGMCHAPSPPHHRLLPLANSCLALFPTPQLPPCAIPHLPPTHFPSSPYSLSILTRLAFHHSPGALSIPLSFPHRPTPILATFLSMACVLKRFLLTLPRKLSLPCVKRGFLRTAEPHRTSQLSPCAPLCRSAISIRCLAGMCYAPAPSHHRLLSRANSCRALCPNPTAPTLRNPTAPTLRNSTSDPDTLSILSLLAFHHSPQALDIPLSFPHPPSPILATFLSTACVLKRFPLTSPRKLPLTCVKLGFLRTAGSH